MGTLEKLAGRVRRTLPSCGAVIAAGGSSQRMEGTDKLFANLQGKSVLLHTLLAFERADCIREIVVVTRADRLEQVSTLCAEAGLQKVSQVVPGGADRLHSVNAGLLALRRDTKLVAVHDGARPLVSGRLIESVVKSAAKHKAALPLLQMRETIKTVRAGRVEETLDRDGIYAAQTPQVFQLDLLKAALQKVIDQGLPVTDDAQAAELLGLKPAWVEGERRNIKITGPEDLVIAGALMGEMDDADRSGL